MKDPNYPSNQPKNPVDDALVDRNSDPDAQVQAKPLKKQGDALLDSTPDNDRPLLEGSLEGERPRTDKHSANSTNDTKRSGEQR
jgi:hypothetical protein